MKIQFSKHCAWRAFYVSNSRGPICHLGIDPTTSYGPQIFGGIGRWRFRFNVPHLRWSTRSSRLYIAAYMLQQRILHRIDGRYKGKRAA